jgi:hypothetical protein
MGQFSSKRAFRIQRGGDAFVDLDVDVDILFQIDIGYDDMEFRL